MRACCGLASANGILDKLDPGGFAVFVQLYTDEIYAPVMGQLPVAAEVGELVPAAHLAEDGQPLYLGGTLVQSGQSDFTIQSLHLDAPGYSRTSVDLHRLINNA